MTGWNLPPGCTDKMVDEAFGYSSGPRGVYRVTITRAVEMTTVVEVQASSPDDAEHDGLIGAAHIPPAKWTVARDDYDVTEVEGPPERDPDDERDSRAERDR